MSLEGVQGNFFQAGLLKIVKNADGEDSFYSPLLRKFYPMTKNRSYISSVRSISVGYK
jgi:hypothetical protein